MNPRMFRLPQITMFNVGNLVVDQPCQIPLPLRWAVRLLFSKRRLRRDIPDFNEHRFASKTLPQSETHPYLTALIQTYLSTMQDIGAETWIMHGTLLAWWWNQKVRSHGLTIQGCPKFQLTGFDRSSHGTATWTSKSRKLPFIFLPNTIT